MSAKKLALVSGTVLAIGLPAASFAGGPNVGVTIGIGGAPVVYYPPPPVAYYPPPPAVYYPRPPVVFYPRPYCYAPPPAVVFRFGAGPEGHHERGFHGRHGHPGGHGHNGHRAHW